MTIEDIVSFLLGLIPYLNAGTVTLLIGLVFDRLGFKITRREFKRKPLESLLLGLCLLLLSSVITALIQSRVSGFVPLLAFVVLLVAYWAMTQI